MSAVPSTSPPASTDAQPERSRVDPTADAYRWASRAKEDKSKEKAGGSPPM